MSYQQLDHIADSIDPLLILILVVMPFVLKIERPWQFLLRAGAALLVVWVLAKGMQSLHLLGKGTRFPSTHWVATLSPVTSMIVLRPRVALILIPVSLAYAWLMVYQRYHTPVELAGALYAVPLTLPFLWPYLKRREPVPALDA